MKLTCVKKLKFVPESYWQTITKEELKDVKTKDEVYKVYCQIHGHHYATKNRKGKIIWL